MILFFDQSFPSPVAYWELGWNATKGVGGSLIYDSSKNHLHAEIDGAYTWRDGINGDSESSVYFDSGSPNGNAVVSNNDNVSYLVMGRNDISVSTWITLSGSTGKTDHVIISFGGYDTTHSGWQVGIKSSGELCIWLSDGDSNYDNLQSSTSISADGEWHHVVFVFDRQNDKTKIYLDNVYDSSIDISNYNNINISKNTTDNLTIGTSSDSSNSNSVNALIDRLRVFNHPISAQHVTRLYSEKN